MQRHYPFKDSWFVLQVNDLVCISDRSYTNEQVLIMEKKILGRLEWNLTVPTPYVFLVRFIKASLTGSDVSERVPSNTKFLEEFIFQRP